MKIPKSITEVTVEIESGRSVSFKPHELATINDFATTPGRFWELLEFIAGMSPDTDTVLPAQPCATCGGTKRVTPPDHMSCMWLPCPDCSASSQEPGTEERKRNA